MMNRKNHNMKDNSNHKKKSISNNKPSLLLSSSKSTTQQSSAVVVVPVVVSATRLCFKNIPLKYNESDLRSYILDKARPFLSSSSSTNTNTNTIITDCKILRDNSNNNKSRRIAFVGFHSPKDTEIIQKKLNKSYCGTSKLIVEYANLPPTTTTTTTTTAGTTSLSKDDSTQHQDNNKEKTNGVVDSKSKNQLDIMEKKKLEFLSVMGVTKKDRTTDTTEKTNTSNKLKFWANDDDTPLHHEVMTSTAKPNNNEDNDNKTDDDDSSSGSSSSSSSTSSHHSEKELEKNDTNHNHENQSTVVTVQNDLDFLRSKQIPILDFDVSTNEIISSHDDAVVVAAETETNRTTTSQQEKGIVHDKGRTSDNRGSDSDSESDSSSSSDDDNDDEDEIMNTSNPFKQKLNRMEQDDKVLQDAKNTKESDRKNDIHGSSTTNNNINNNNITNNAIVPNRIFIRNLPFSVTEEDIIQHFQTTCGGHDGSSTIIEECHIPIDDQKRNKGFAFVTFYTTESALKAIQLLDGTDFHGRLIHIMPAKMTPTSSSSSSSGYQSHEYQNMLLAIDNDTTLSYKEKVEKKRQLTASKDTTGWSSSYVRTDAVIDNLASRLGLKKSDILNVKDKLSAGDAAVRLALGETAIIEENRKYFEQYHIDMETLVSYHPTKDGTTTTPTSTTIKRSKTMILVKNLPHDTMKDELMKLFTSFGTAVPHRILLPPSRTIALIEYLHPNDAKNAFKRTAYRRYKNVPIYVEWAPLAAIQSTSSMDMDTDHNQKNDQQTTTTTNNNKVGDSKMNKNENNDDEDVDNDELEEAIVSGVTHSLYVKNLNFSTTDEQLLQYFQRHYNDVRAVRIPKKILPIPSSNNDNKKRTRDNYTETQRSLSMGFGFVEFGSTESVRNAIKKLQGTILDGHALELKVSTHSGNNNNGSINPTDRFIREAKLNSNDKVPPTKLMVRNVPFQASRKELLQLFGSFGQLKKVRLPKKMDGTHRGFAFIEYVTSKEAMMAMKILSQTHLYGRHLVLEFASTDTDYDKLNREYNTKQEEQQTSTTVVVPTGKKIKFE